MKKSLPFYQNYVDRLAALIEGPEGYYLGEEKKNKAIIELIDTLPDTDYKPSGISSGFHDFAFTKQIMNWLIEDDVGATTDLRETLNEDAEYHWERRNDLMCHKLEKATMLLHYMEELDGKAMKEVDKLFKEGASIGKAIGLKLSDRKFEVNVTDPNGAHFLKQLCQPEVDQNRDDYVTVDIRIRSNQDRPASEYPARIEFYGSEEELTKMVSFVASEDTPFRKEIGVIEKSDVRVPGYIDGQSFRSKEVIRNAMNQEKTASMSL